MKIPYKTEPDNFVSMDHKQFVTSNPEHVMDLVMNMPLHNDMDMSMADVMIGRIRADKISVETQYKEPVARAFQAHKKLTKERGKIIENYDWAEKLLKEKMKVYHMATDRKALAEKEVTTTSITPPKPRSVLNHTTFIEKWKFRITDETKIPRNYMMPNDKSIGETVRSMGGMAEINGVQVYRDDEVRIKP